MRVDEMFSPAAGRSRSGTAWNVFAQVPSQKVTATQPRDELPQQSVHLHVAVGLTATCAANEPASGGRAARAVAPFTTNGRERREPMVSGIYSRRQFFLIILSAAVRGRSTRALLCCPLLRRTGEPSELTPRPQSVPFPTGSRASPRAMKSDDGAHLPGEARAVPKAVRAARRATGWRGCARRFRPARRAWWQSRRLLPAEPVV